jgi:hypothetical protein
MTSLYVIKKEVSEDERDEVGQMAINLTQPPQKWELVIIRVDDGVPKNARM